MCICVIFFACCCSKILCQQQFEEGANAGTVPVYSVSWQEGHSNRGFRELAIYTDGEKIEGREEAALHIFGSQV